MNKREENIRLAVFLNIGFTVIELVGGLLTNSMAILSDALHDFGDSNALIISWIAEKKSQKPADQKRTFGYQRISLFASIFAALVLVVGSLAILLQAIPRLISPEHVNAQGMMGLAVIGVLVNGAAFLRLKRGESLNEKVLSWHMLEDVLGWIIILIGSILILVWDNHLIDPIMTIGFIVFILWGVSKNLREAGDILMQSVPKHIKVDEVKKSLLNIKGVSNVHDIHIWSLEGETDIFTAHIVVTNEVLKKPSEIKKQIKNTLKKHHIEHSTLELESKEYCSGIECK